MEGPIKDDVGAGTRKVVLLVDDETPILEFGKEILAFYGYEALTAENGQTALEVFTKNQDLIGLVILDLSMPTMDGCECLKRILQVDPGAKVFISSGYSSKEKVREVLELGASGFLVKPFRFDELAKQVSAIL